MAYSHSPRIVTDRLILALDAANSKCYPGSGTVVKDLTGINSDAAIYSGTTWDASGYFGFDGTDDALYYPSSSTFNLGTGPITLEAWSRIYAMGVNNIANIIVRGNPLCDGCEGGFQLMYSSANSSTISVRFDGTGTIGDLRSVGYTSPTSFIDGQFHHIVGLRDGVNLKLYLDGQLVASSVNDNQVDVAANSPVYISGWSAYRGQMDVAVAKMYDKALSAEEVLQNYNALKGRFGL